MKKWLIPSIGLMVLIIASFMASQSKAKAGNIRTWSLSEYKDPFLKTEEKHITRQDQR